MKALLWYILFSFLIRSVFTFIIIKPKTKVSFSFSNIGSIITKFASQKLKNVFSVTVRGPLWIINTSPHAFVVKFLVVIIWSHTWQIPSPHGSEPAAFSIFGNDAHLVFLKAFTISESQNWNLRKKLFYALYLMLAKFEVPPISFWHSETLDSKWC